MFRKQWQPQHRPLSCQKSQIPGFISPSAVHRTASPPSRWRVCLQVSRTSPLSGIVSSTSSTATLAILSRNVCSLFSATLSALYRGARLPSHKRLCRQVLRHSSLLGCQPLCRPAPLPHTLANVPPIPLTYFSPSLSPRE